MQDSKRREPHHLAPEDTTPAQAPALPGAIRKLWVGEGGALRDHLLRLDPESRRTRFGSPVNRHFIEQYAARALSSDSVVHGFFAGGELRGVGELRTFGAAIPLEAEAAFSLERAWQGHGIGSELLERTILAAQNRGIRTIYLNCLAENRRMQAIAKKYEASLRVRADEVVGEVVNNRATPLSFARELIADGHGMVSAILDLHARAFRTA